MTVPMPKTRKQFIDDVARQSQQVLALYGMLSQLDTLWNGTPDYATLMDQSELDSVPELSEAGLTTTQLADAIYALSLIKGNVQDHLPNLSLLSDIPTI